MLAEAGLQLVGEVGEGERLDLGVAEAGDLGQGPVEVLGQRVTHGIELDRKLGRVGHRAPLLGDESPGNQTGSVHKLPSVLEPKAVGVHRVTINEIARRSGVSKGAVSYALNGRPGVSAETRARILDVARELGWAPNRTARLLSGSRTDTFGLILARDARTLGSEPFYMEFIAGLESELITRSYGLLVQLTSDLDDELALYPKWSSERRVDGVVVVDVRVDDPRIEALRTAGDPRRVRR